ncbi:MAG TPA: peptidoglycan-associated lipoprotein Pal [Burkholderiales bacterium]|nr:peptidoglycan-associated lipoprotein Pal [Burkholderiales bacterium]
MRVIILSSLSAAALALLAVGCATTDSPDQQSPAGVEDRSSPGKPGARSGPIDRKPIASVDLTQSRKDPASALRDPANILSKRSIYYDLDQYDVKDQYRGLVEAHAKYLRDNPSVRILIQGNTDERGSREYNVSLGQRRSDGVKKMLLLLGAKDNQIESVSLGEEKPQSEGHSEDAWSKNRRSDILYGGEY